MDKYYKVAFVPHCLQQGKRLEKSGLHFSKCIIIFLEMREEAFKSFRVLRKNTQLILSLLTYKPLISNVGRKQEDYSLNKSCRPFPSLYLIYFRYFSVVFDSINVIQ